VPALRSLAALVAMVTVVAVIVHSGVFHDVSVEGLRGRIESYGALAPLVFIGLLVAGLFVPGPELPIGGTALGITPGIGLGAYLGDAVTDATSWKPLLAPAVALPTLVAVAFAVTGAVVGRRVFGGDGAR
jgi:uncharacterized membrane protein YdjX (TVP38/TMEM64 family)